jgi:hypothetical protein
VAIDHAADTLLVSWRENGQEIWRRMDLPRRRALVERATVLLAGNLARNEADELAAELRGDSKDAQFAALKRKIEAEDAAEEDEDEHAVDRLHDVLAHAEASNRVRRTANAWLTGLGFASLGIGGGIGVYGLVSPQQPAWAKNFLFYGLDAHLAFLATAALVRPGSFDGIRRAFVAASRDGSPRSVRDATEHAWLYVADAESNNRRVVGWFEAVGGVLLVGIDASWIVSLTKTPQNSMGFGPAVTSMAAGVLGAASGISLITTDGPVASALHEYERSSWHTVRLVETTGLLSPVVVPTPGGAMFGLEGSF